MIAAVHQPQYLPWLGYFNKIDRADVFCFLDNVQYKKSEWQNRNRIKTVDGWQWLTKPVLFQFPDNICDVRINNAVNWRRKHLQALVTNYGKAPYFSDFIGMFERIYATEWDLLAELNIELIREMMNLLGLEQKETALASGLRLRDDPNDRLIDICRALECDTYLAGTAGADYMDLVRFAEAGIQVVFQEFIHPSYPQLFGNFLPRLSTVDLLFNCGPESLKRIRKANP